MLLMHETHSHTHNIYTAYATAARDTLTYSQHLHSVYYCCTAARELILKDFAFDGDDTRMRRAGHVMAQSLAINLALVTCKDPLRISLTNHLRSSLQQAVQTMGAQVGGGVVAYVLGLCVCRLDAGCWGEEGGIRSMRMWFWVLGACLCVGFCAIVSSVSAVF